VPGIQIGGREQQTTFPWSGSWVCIAGVRTARGEFCPGGEEQALKNFNSTSTPSDLESDPPHQIVYRLKG
jgi:hypothetical protein